MQARPLPAVLRVRLISSLVSLKNGRSRPASPPDSLTFPETSSPNTSTSGPPRQHRSCWSFYTVRSLPPCTSLTTLTHTHTQLTLYCRILHCFHRVMSFTYIVFLFISPIFQDQIPAYLYSVSLVTNANWVKCITPVIIAFSVYVAL